jgi:hypothetical protein
LARLEQERHYQHKDESREHQKDSWAHGSSGFENHNIIHTRNGEKFLSLTTGGDVWIQFKNLQVVRRALKPVLGHLAEIDGLADATLYGVYRGRR